MPHREWSERWRKLASQDLMTGSAGEDVMVERWRDLARRLDGGGDQRRDRILEFVEGHLSSETTVIDVGAGVGRWTVPLAEHVRAVTAVEPVPGMRRILEERLAARGLGNVRVVDQPWMEARVKRHDVAVAAYSMYTSPDLAAFGHKMEESARL